MNKATIKHEIMKQIERVQYRKEDQVKFSIWLERFVFCFDVSSNARFLRIAEPADADLFMSFDKEYLELEKFMLFKNREMEAEKLLKSALYKIRQFFTEHKAGIKPEGRRQFWITLS